MEDGFGRFSLDGSRKNSLLTVTGDMEINISMPDSVRRSYSMEDGFGRFSLDGSRKNSLLTVTGDMEINISMPDSVRRSMSVDKVSFSGVSPSVTSVSVKQSSLDDTVKEKISLPVPGFISSDSEEEEVFISGMLKKKTLKSKVKSRHRD